MSSSAHSIPKRPRYLRGRLASFVGGKCGRPGHPAGSPVSAEGGAGGEHLTDQLLIPLALARGGAFRTLGLSRHAQTNIEVIRAFLDVGFEIDRDAPPGCVAQVRG